MKFSIITLLTISSLLFIQPTQSTIPMPGLIDHVCRLTPHHHLCALTLKSHKFARKITSHADVAAFAKITLGVIAKKLPVILATLHKVHEQCENSEFKMALEGCIQSYTQISTEILTQALNCVDKGDLEGIKEHALNIAKLAASCQKKCMAFTVGSLSAFAKGGSGSLSGGRGSFIPGFSAGGSFNPGSSAGESFNPGSSAGGSINTGSSAGGSAGGSMNTGSSAGGSINTGSGSASAGGSTNTGSSSGSGSGSGSASAGGSTNTGSGSASAGGSTNTGSSSGSGSGSGSASAGGSTNTGSGSGSASAGGSINTGSGSASAGGSINTGSGSASAGSIGSASALKPAVMAAAKVIGESNEYVQNMCAITVSIVTKMLPSMPKQTTLS